jgi:hypothetical protein
MGDGHKKGVCNASALGALNGNDCCLRSESPLAFKICRIAGKGKSEV